MCAYMSEIIHWQGELLLKKQEKNWTVLEPHSDLHSSKKQNKIPLAMVIKAIWHAKSLKACVYFSESCLSPQCDSAHPSRALSPDSDTQQGQDRPDREAHSQCDQQRWVKLEP